jgi:hypothetical protein
MYDIPFVLASGVSTYLRNSNRREHTLKAGKNKTDQEPFRGAWGVDTFSLISALTLTTSAHKLDASPLTA